MIKTAIIWFNGPSAKELHKTLPKKYTEFGCNFIRRDRAVDHVCVHDPITKPLIDIEDNVKYWARNGQKDKIFDEVIKNKKFSATTDIENAVPNSDLIPCSL